MDILGLIDLPVWVILLVGALVLLMVYGYLPYSLWTKMGYPGPKPKPFIGNAADIGKMGMEEVFKYWKKTYGPVVGVYLMRRPMILVSDVNMLKKILVTEFNNFSDRGFIIPKEFSNTVTGNNLLFLEGSHWKWIRNLLTPSFSVGKLREKAGLIRLAVNKATDRLVQAANNNEKVDGKHFFCNYTMDVILSTVFSVDPEGNRKISLEFQDFVHNVTKQPPFRVRCFMIAGMFPILNSILGKISDKTLDAQNFFVNFVRQVMNSREDPDPHSDFLQNMLNAESHDSFEGRKKMTFAEIIPQTNLFFLGGNDTTSNTLMWMAYLLAKHQDVQAQLYQEVKDQLKDEELNYDNVTRLKFMEACIRETLRVYPPTVVFTRRCVHETVINGWTIPKGAGIYVPVKTICSDPELYPDPERFNPNRFVKGHPDEVEDVPYLSFGIGPRNCIGMRLALYQVSLTMAAMLRKVKFAGVNTVYLPKARMGGIVSLEDPMLLDIELR